MSFRIGLLLFPDITQLDMTGPYEVFTKFPGAEVHLVWKSLDPVTANGGMKIMPTTTFASCPQLDVVCVPGGPGMNPLLNDEETLDLLAQSGRRRALRHLRLHRRAGARRGGTSQRQARGNALDEPRHAESVRRHAGRSSAWSSMAT